VLRFLLELKVLVEVLPPPVTGALHRHRASVEPTDSCESHRVPLPVSTVHKDLSRSQLQLHFAVKCSASFSCVFVLVHVQCLLFSAGLVTSKNNALQLLVTVAKK